MAPKRPDTAPAPAECANCGASIPHGAKACPECGADDRTGWRETDLCDGLDLPDGASAEDSGRPTPARRREGSGIPWYWWCAGIALVAVLALRALALL
ncbi:MAG: zinc-ribbon domain-containing protein [Opitutus sp.]